MSYRDAPEWDAGYKHAINNFTLVHKAVSPGGVVIIAEADIGWRCEVVASRIADPQGKYRYMVSMLSPRRTCYGMNTIDPHEDYLYEKFLWPAPVSGGEFALIATSIKLALFNCATGGGL